MKKKILFIVNADWFYCSHRLNIGIEAIKDALIEQIDNPVQWSKSIKSLSKLSSEFLEIGPKKVLSNIIKKIDDSLTITTYNSIENL